MSVVKHENLNIQAYDFVLIGKYLSTFQRSMLPSYSGSMQCTRRSSLPMDVVSYPKKALNFTNTAVRSSHFALFMHVGMGHVRNIIITIIINYLYTRYL
jgi:hypothetical protein